MIRSNEIDLVITTNESDPTLRRMMRDHYSRPNGFVARRIIYAVICNGGLYGFTVAGSSTRFLPNREAFFGRSLSLNCHVNNTFFHIEKPYPIRNFAQRVVKLWRERVAVDWYAKYGDLVYGYETLIEPPRTGECYLRDGWEAVGETKGLTCKRVADPDKIGSDSWNGRRVWNYDDLRPKLVLCRRIHDL